MFAFRFMAIGPFLAEIQQILYLTLIIQDQGHGQGQTRWSHLSPKVQSICLLFVSWQSDHFWLRYSKFYIWPWKFKIKVMAKVKPNGHIWALEFNRYICFSFRRNRTIFGWDIANSIFDLEKSSGQGHDENRPKSNLQVRANNRAKNERNPKSCSKVIAWTRICGRRRRTNRYKNIKLPPVYRADLIRWYSGDIYVVPGHQQPPTARFQIFRLLLVLIFNSLIPERFEWNLHK